MANKIEKIGTPKKLAERRGKGMMLQKFLNAGSGEIKEWSLFYGGKISSIVLPVTADKEIIIIKQFRHGSDSIQTELPGGNVEEKENPMETAIRELEEETGYKASKIIQLAKKIFFEPSCFVEFFYPVLALGCIKIKNQKLDTGEDIEVKIISLKDWISLTENGHINDAKSIATTHLAMRYLRMLL